MSSYSLEIFGENLEIILWRNKIYFGSWGNEISIAQENKLILKLKYFGFKYHIMIYNYFFSFENYEEKKSLNGGTWISRKPVYVCHWSREVLQTVCRSVWFFNL